MTWRLLWSWENNHYLTVWHLFRLLWERKTKRQEFYVRIKIIMWTVPSWLHRQICQPLSPPKTSVDFTKSMVNCAGTYLVKCIILIMEGLREGVFKVCTSTSTKWTWRRWHLHLVVHLAPNFRTFASCTRQTEWFFSPPTHCYSRLR